MIKKYFVKEVSNPEMIKCDTCDGTGKIIGTITSDSLTEPMKDKELSCPICGGSGKVATGKINHYSVGTVVVYGEAHVEDGGEGADYYLGFVCDDDEMIEKFKTQNNISDFVSFPSALSFYMKRDDVPLYDSYMEANEVVVKKESEYVEPEK